MSSSTASKSNQESDNVSPSSSTTSTVVYKHQEMLCRVIDTIHDVAQTMYQTEERTKELTENIFILKRELVLLNGQNKVLEDKLASETKRLIYERCRAEEEQKAYASDKIQMKRLLTAKIRAEEQLATYRIWADRMDIIWKREREENIRLSNDAETLLQQNSQLLRLSSDNKL